MLSNMYRTVVLIWTDLSFGRCVQSSLAAAGVEGGLDEPVRVIFDDEPSLCYAAWSDVKDLDPERSGEGSAACLFVVQITELLVSRVTVAVKRFRKHWHNALKGSAILSGQLRIWPVDFVLGKRIE